MPEETNLVPVKAPAASQVLDAEFVDMDTAIATQAAKYTEHGAGWAKMCDDWAKSFTEANEHNWRLHWANWKQNALVNRALKIPIPPKPAPPLQGCKCDVELAKRRYVESLLSGIPIKQDYFSFYALPIPAGFDTLDEPGTPQPDDPISKPDISVRGRWYIAPGDQTPMGTVRENHPRAGNVRRMSLITPFSNLHWWEAIDEASMQKWQAAAFELMFPRKQISDK